MKTGRFGAWHEPRVWAALAIVVAAYFLADLFESTIYHVLAHRFGVHHSAPNTLGQASYGLRMLVRLIWDLALWVVISLTLGRSPLGFPMSDRKLLRNLLIGLGCGLAVMFVTMLGIGALGAASVAPSGQTLFASLRNGGNWLLLDLLGAAGEEIYGRAVILAVAERFLGWRGAVLVSGLMFSGLHLSNPGAAWVWLLRLFIQGALLAYAVFRTGSLWWSIGYHTGWNWVSAPLFGAAGSGYMDEGHIFNFFPHGSVWITGGAVGPEGSLLAFSAVLAAFGLLLMTTSRKESSKSSRKTRP
jgi:membrane protease YdiL (CAAX protease family)